MHTKYICLFLIIILNTFINCKNIKNDIQKNDINKISNNDLLEKYLNKPKHLEFIEYKSKNEQIIESSLYRLEGKYAAIVEKYLKNKCKMGKLKFICCGWEPRDGKHGYFKKDEYFKEKGLYRSYIVSMYSEETLINKRKNWAEIKYFYVLAEIYEY